MFTVDDVSRMMWFRPASLEPLYKFELIGLLVSLAIYNGITLPITFPEALYRRLLELPVTSINQLQDGWPELSKGFEEMLNWKDGDVGDIFMRTYEFSFDGPGRTIHVNMEAFARDDPWPAVTSNSEVDNRKGKGPMDSSKQGENMTKRGLPPLNSPAWAQPLEVNESQHLQFSDAAGEPSLVSNENRTRYVEDYIFWLTDKSIRPEYEAFARGFYTCLDKKALSILSPTILKNITEGFQNIDIGALERVTKYEDGYSPDHPLMRGFWDIVSRYAPEQKRQLLEFVTASDRVPVGGVESVVFCIIRNGGDSERIPTAMTCFGKLLLPEYTGVAKLEQKLRIALENSKGFGSV